MQTDDTLWKGIIENISADFIRFFYKEADELFDLKKGVVFLDKELEQLLSSEGNVQSPKYVDKLIKVYNKTGEEESQARGSEIEESATKKERQKGTHTWVGEVGSKADQSQRWDDNRQMSEWHA